MVNPFSSIDGGPLSASVGSIVTTFVALNTLFFHFHIMLYEINISFRYLGILRFPLGCRFGDGGAGYFRLTGREGDFERTILALLRQHIVVQRESRSSRSAVSFGEMAFGFTQGCPYCALCGTVLSKPDCFAPDVGCSPPVGRCQKADGGKMRSKKMQGRHTGTFHFERKLVDAAVRSEIDWLQPAK